MAYPATDPAISAARKARLEALVAQGHARPGVRVPGKGSAIMAAARAEGVRPCAITQWLKTQERWRREGRDHYLPDWAAYRPMTAASAMSSPRPRGGPARRFLLTAAQDETGVHDGFWRNLLAFSSWIGADLRVAGFTYNKALFTDHETRTGVFAEAVQPYMAHQRLDLGGVLFCAEMNILPTAVKPLSGLETYSAGRWAVFPHAKLQLVSVPTIHGRQSAQIMTTGACTVPNYVQKKAGQKAEFHHVIGAALVEIDSEDRVFVRQINAAEDGSFQDLDARVERGRVTTGHRVEAITYGDIHRPKIDPQVARAIWGIDVDKGAQVAADGMLDQLKPRYQFFHDLIDFASRNHHRRGDAVFALQVLARGAERIDDEMRLCADFLRQTARDWCISVQIASNHDEALPRWLRETDPRSDPVNLRFWCEANAAQADAVDRGDAAFDVVRWALARHDDRALEDVVFVPRAASYVICQAAGGIECSLHGDIGPNGARGTPNNLARVATRMNVGHYHSPAIQDGVYAAGLCGLMDQGYNVGPSGWAHTQIVTYPNGKRTLITLQDGRWRA